MLSRKELSFSIPAISCGPMGSISSSRNSAPKNNADAALQWFFASPSVGHNWAPPPPLFGLKQYRTHQNVCPFCQISFQVKRHWLGSDVALPIWPPDGNACKIVVKLSFAVLNPHQSPPQQWKLGSHPDHGSKEGSTHNLSCLYDGKLPKIEGHFCLKVRPLAMVERSTWGEVNGHGSDMFFVGSKNLVIIK